MKTKNKIAVLAVATLVATGSAFAQNANVNTRGEMDFDGPGGQGGGMMGRPPLGGPFGQARQEFKQDLKEKREWMHASTTTGAATPTPWKNLRDNMKNIRDDMKGKMASLTDAQVSAIALKLGITVDELKAKLATGTPLRAIIGNKISKEDMTKILPMPMMGSGTMATSGMPMMRPQGERQQGFFNSIRDRFFGPRNRGGDENGDMNAQAGVNVNAEANVGLGGFFKRLFNF